MYTKLLQLVVILFVAKFAHVRAFGVIGNTLPFSSCDKLNYETYSPINIETRDVKNITTKPLFFYYALVEKAKLINTGKAVELILDQPFTLTYLTGGVLFSDVYFFEKARFYWTNNLAGTAATTIDGKQGTPLEAVIYFYNKKYGSFKNALHYRDGLVQLSTRIVVLDTVIPNPLFIPFEIAAQGIRNPGNSVEILNLFGYYWFSIFPWTTSYYAYPGAYVDYDGVQYSCSTTIILPRNPLHFISKKQFEDTFGWLWGLNGKLLSHSTPQYPAGPRPIVHTTGLVEVPCL